MDRHPDSEIIDRLRGTAAAARFCEASSLSVNEWCRNGKSIPKARRKFLELPNPEAFRSSACPLEVRLTSRRSDKAHAPAFANSTACPDSSSVPDERNSTCRIRSNGHHRHQWIDSCPSLPFTSETTQSRSGSTAFSAPSRSFIRISMEGSPSFLSASCRYLPSRSRAMDFMKTKSPEELSEPMRRPAESLSSDTARALLKSAQFSSI